MKFFKIIFLFNFIFLKLNCNFGDHGDVSSKTIFNDIMPFTSGFPERIENSQYIHDINKHENKFFFSTTILYSMSKNNEGLSSYFSSNGKKDFTLFGGADNYLNTNQYKFRRDLDTSPFNINDESFFSISKINYYSSIKALGLNFFYNFYENKENNSDLLIKLFCPFYNINHKIKIKESIKNQKEINLYSLKKSLSNKNYKYVNFNFCEDGIENNKIGNFELNFSYRNLISNNCFMENILGLIFPNEDPINRKNNENSLFFPRIGNNGHWGIQYEGHLTIIFYEQFDYAIRGTLLSNSTYLIPSDQKRVFDLMHRPWSRYLQTYKNLNKIDQKIEPLCNFLNLKCKVSPNFSFTSTTEIGLYKENLNLSLGYTMYARQAEGIQIKENISDLVLKSGDFLKINSNDNYINSLRSINLRNIFNDQKISGDPSENEFYNLSIIKPEDIDISSASHPAVFMGIFYGKIGFEKSNSFFANLGISYRYCYNNSALRYKTLWGSLGFEF